MRSTSFSVPAALGALTLLVLTGCAITGTTGTTETPPPEAEAAPLPNLWAAAAAGDLDALKAHGAAGTNLDRRSRRGATALVTAIAFGQADAARWLLDNGADVNVRTADGGNALLAAAFFGESNIARMLLDAGADATASNRRRQTVWDVAAQDWRRSKAVAKRFKLALARDAVLAGRSEILSLLQPELNTLAQDNAWVAAAVGDVEAVRRHLDSGLDADARNPRNGATLLATAAVVGQSQVAAMLIDAGADVNEVNLDSTAPLHAAAFAGQPAMLALLLDSGADPNTMSWGGTPLMAAELDWPTTQYVATTLRLAVDEATTMAGKAEAAALLRSATAQ